jgi:iron-sulfur cluster repair protein YtfE (RIC family)
MKTLSQYLRSDHRYCDELFELVAPLAQAGKWQEARHALEAFEEALERHLAREERVLFPALERAHGAPMGPTHMMRIEHRGMRDLLLQMRDTLERSDADELDAATQTLRITLQQHNMKEEGVLYPMADRLLHAEAGELLQAFEGRLSEVAT